MVFSVSAATSAELVPLSGCWSAACLRNEGASLIRGDAPKIAKIARLDCVTDAPGGKVLGFREDCALAIDSAGAETLVQRLPWVVRRCLRLVDGKYLLLVGGQRRAGLLWQTRAVVWNAQTGVIEPAPYVRQEWNAFDTTAAPATADGHQRVIVSVRKQAPFDRAWRLRPFLFEYRSRDGRFLPLWKGTSFSRPHLSVSFASWGADSDEAEVAALEDVGGTERAISVYEFDGGMTVTHMSAPMRFGSRVGSVACAGNLLPVAFVRKCGGGRLVAFGEGNKMMLAGVSNLEPKLQTERLATVPLAWTIIPSGTQPSALALMPGRELRLLPLRPLP
ncbi:MAG: hypothetical protein ACM3VW_10885 [Bacteroidota bacterium]